MASSLAPGLQEFGQLRESQSRRGATRPAFPTLGIFSQPQKIVNPCKSPRWTRVLYLSFCWVSILKKGLILGSGGFQHAGSVDVEDIITMAIDFQQNIVCCGKHSNQPAMRIRIISGKLGDGFSLCMPNRFFWRAMAILCHHDGWSPCNPIPKVSQHGARTSQASPVTPWRPASAAAAEGRASTHMVPRKQPRGNMTHTYIYPSIYLSIYLSIHLSIYPSIYLSIHPSIHPSICVCVCAPIYL